MGLTIEIKTTGVDTSGMDAMPWNVDVNLMVRQLALELYSRPEAACREAASNAIDSGTKRIEFVMRDGEFSMEDWGTGVNRAESLAGIALEEKKGLANIGEKGIGRLALLRLGQQVEFLSNNNEIGIRVIYELDHPPLKQTMRFDRFLPHQGTKVIVHNVDPEFLPKQKELLSYLGKTFAPLILWQLIITVNGTRVILPEKFIAKEDHILTMPNGTQIRGGLIPEKKSDGRIDIYRHRVLVKEKQFIALNQVRGWVNYDELTPRTDRDDLVEDKKYHLFMDYFTNHIKRHFAKIEESDSDASTKQMKNKIRDLFKRFLKNVDKILPPITGQKGQLLSDVWLQGGGIEGGKGGDSGKDIPGFEVSGNSGPHQLDGPDTNKINSTTSSDGDKPILKGRVPKQNKNERGPNDPIIVEHKGDVDGWPVSVLFGKRPIIILNKSNPITKICLGEKAVLGSKLFRLIPFLARAFHDSVRKDVAEPTPDQYMREVYRTTIWLYENSGLV
jgi:hypothetical protein